METCARFPTFFIDLRSSYPLIHSIGIWSILHHRRLDGNALQILTFLPPIFVPYRYRC